MNITFREIIEADYTEVCSFPKSAGELFFLFPNGTYPLTPDQLKVSVDKRTENTVLLADGKVGGFANFITAEQNDHCSIGNVILNPDLRGKGLGEKLISEMCRIAKEKYKVKRIRISCFNENRNGLLLYTKLGFKPTEIVEWKKSDCDRVALIHLDKISRVKCLPEENNMVVETERLRLETIEEKHFDDLALLLANPKVHELWPEPKTRNREQSRDYFEKIQGHYREHGFSYYAVIRKEDEQFLGICGLLPEEADGTPEVEVAYRIDDQFWGNGYAPEAARAVMNYAHEQLKWDSVISLILPQNHNSIRVAEKNGLVPDGEKSHVGMVHTIWRYRWK